MNEEELKMFGIDPNIKEHTDEAWGTLRVGDRFIVWEDNEDQGLFEGDEGVILGFAHYAAAKPTDDNYAIRIQFGNAKERTEAIVEIDGMDPTSIRDPFEYIQVI
jgi:hypothetical protein